VEDVGCLFFIHTTNEDNKNIMLTRPTPPKPIERHRQPVLTFTLISHSSNGLVISHHEWPRIENCQGSHNSKTTTTEITIPVIATK